MVFVNGTPLTQVISSGELVEGAFYVDDARGQISVWPPSGTNMSTATVEAAVRPAVFTLSRSIRRWCWAAGRVAESRINVLFQSRLPPSKIKKSRGSVEDIGIAGIPPCVMVGRESALEQIPDTSLQVRIEKV